MNYPISFISLGRVSACSILASVAFIIPIPRAVSSVLLDINSNGTMTSDPGGNTFGWSFSVGSQSITIGALGIWDKDSDGLSGSHQVGLWNSLGVLIDSATIKSGTDSVLYQGFRYETLSSPVILNAGATFYLGALYPTSGDEMVQFNGSYTFDSAITYSGTRFSTADTLSFPDQINSSVNGFFGPNAQTTAVPEPQEAYAIVCIGLLSFAFWRWKRCAARRLKDESLFFNNPEKTAASCHWQ